MEILDILDKNGNIIGSKERKEIYKDGDIHRTVHIWIINDKNELLVQKRSPKKETFANLWAISTAGHVISGETSIQAALRELKEELDLNVKEEELKYLFTIERHQDISDDIHINTFDDVYLLHRNLDCEKTKLQKKELTDIMFIYYEYLEEQYKKKNDNFVPASEEHDKLFEYLHKNLKKCYIDLNFTYTKDDLLDLALYKSIYNFRNIVIIILAIILMIIGFTKYMWLFYFSIFFIPMYFMINDYIARRKVNNTLYLMEKTNTFKDNIKLHDEYFRCKNLKDIVIFYAGLKIVENKSHIFIFLNRDNAIILNKKDMHNDDIEFLKKRKSILYKKIK